MAGPAFAAAACPVRTKIPVPMIAPTPSETSCAGPSTRFNVPSPGPICSASICSMDFVAKMDIWHRTDRRRRCPEAGPERVEETLKFSSTPSAEVTDSLLRATESRR